MLLHGVEVHSVRLGTELGRTQLVLDLHDSFIGLDEWYEFVTLLELEALFIQCPVEVRQESRYLVEIIL